MISIIIPARDCEAVIGPCLDSLAGQTVAAGEVIVVDDASTDRTAEIVARDYPWVKLLRLEKNLGVGGACLEGLRSASGEWIALVNSDVEAMPGWIEEVMAAAKAWPDAGMIASRILLAEPAGSLDSLGIAISRTGMARLRAHGQPDAPDESNPRFERVFGPSGAAAFYQRELIEQAGFFEPDFFLYYDEVDMAWRAGWSGFDCILANRARVIHRHSYSILRMNVNKRYWLQKNRLRTMLRNWPAAWILKYLPLIILFDAASVALAVSEGSITAPFRARRDFLKHLRKDLTCRRETMRKAAESGADLGVWFSVDHLPADPGGGDD